MTVFVIIIPIIILLLRELEFLLADERIWFSIKLMETAVGSYRLKIIKNGKRNIRDNIQYRVRILAGFTVNF